ncbi:MAG: hypothetical protein ABSF09_13235 [Candidatus Bathyarchaeia archaeon]
MSSTISREFLGRYPEMPRAKSKTIPPRFKRHALAKSLGKELRRELATVSVEERVNNRL